MNLGNVLPALEAKFDAAVDCERLVELYHSGVLSPLLPHGCCWIAEIDPAGELTSLESQSIADPDLHPFVAMLNADGGELAIIQESLPDGSKSIHLIGFPYCQLQERFARVGEA